MLVPTADLLYAARDVGYAIGAFNVYNLEGVKAVVGAAEAQDSPVILQVHPKALSHGGQPFVALCIAAARQARIPAAVQLDHSSSPEAIRLALEAGISSIMADGSHMDYEDNLAFTSEMRELAHRHKAAVEGELGRISGTEDGLTLDEYEARMTDPKQAAAFVDGTGVDALAVCIGNVHGPYPAEPQLDFDRLRHIGEQVAVPLVLHGASGLPDAMIRRSVELGICKFNVNTELRQAYLKAMRACLDSPEPFDLLDVMQGAIVAMQTVASAKIALFGSRNVAGSPL